MLAWIYTGLLTMRATQIDPNKSARSSAVHGSKLWWCWAAAGFRQLQSITQCRLIWAAIQAPKKQQHNERLSWRQGVGHFIRDSLWSLLHPACFVLPGAIMACFILRGPLCVSSHWQGKDTCLLHLLFNSLMSNHIFSPSAKAVLTKALFLAGIRG